MAEEEEESRRNTGQPNLVDAAGTAGERARGSGERPFSNRGVGVVGGGGGGGGRDSFRMSGRPRTTSFAEGNKPPANPPLGGMKISSKYHNLACALVSLFLPPRLHGFPCEISSFAYIALTFIQFQCPSTAA